MKNNIKLYIITLATIAISGCCNDCPKRPTITSTAYTDEKNLVPLDQQVILGKELETEWWSLFKNESLKNVINLAIKDNYNIVVAKESLMQAEQSVKSLRGTLWPQVDLLANAGRMKYGVALFGPVSLRIPPFTYYELGPAVSWNIDLFGQTKYAIKKQEALQQYQRHNLDAVYITLTSNVVAQALEIASVKAQIAATEIIIKEDEKTLTLVQQAYKASTHSMVDILGAKSQLENDRALMPALQQRLNVAKHALAILVGKSPAEWSAPDFELDYFTLPQELPVIIPSQLVRKRPDILAAEDNLNAACAALGLAKANFYPSLVLTANTLQEALTPGGLFKAVNNTFAIAANLTAPLFQGGTLTAEQRKAESAYREMLAQYQQIILTAFQDVANALTALAHDYQLIIAEQQAVKAAKDSLELSYKSFRVGTLGLLDIQARQRDLAQAQLNLVKAQSQRFIDTANLFVALGGSPISADKQVMCKNDI